MSPLHGYTVLANYNGVNRAGSVATYKCNQGYVLWGPRDHVCGEDGVWHVDASDTTTPTCDLVPCPHPRHVSPPATPTCDLVTCPHPPDVDHSHMELLNDTLTWGAVILYTCQHSPRLAESKCLQSRFNKTTSLKSRERDELNLKRQMMIKVD